MTNDDPTKLLQRLGERRQRHLEAGERLAEEIRQALAATEGQVSRTDAASLLGVDRTLLYKTYLTSK
jgi:transcriptional regulator of acetoin/glycerol metabolism